VSVPPTTRTTRIPRALAVLASLIAPMAGCDTAPSAPGRGPASQRGSQSGLFDSVADTLDHLEQFDSGQMLPQMTDRLNQWVQQEKPNVRWRLDPLVAKLPKPLAALPQVRTLDAMQFRVNDAWFLQQAVWQRDASRIARGDRFTDVEVASRLFDWTVRNVWLEPRGDALDRSPSEILMLGRGTEWDRAWIFILLARQQGLDVVLLGIPTGDAATSASDEPSASEKLSEIRPWCAALIVGDQMFLFDCRLGLPIPGPAGQGVATLAQVAADDTLLRRLDIDEAHRYPVRAEELKQLVAFVEGSPQSLSRRMALVESRLTGKRRLLLSSPASAQAERAKKVPLVSDARLWPHPFETVAALAKASERQSEAASREMYMFQAIPSLFTARAMYFKGAYDGENGAKRHLLNARPSNKTIENWKMPAEMAKKVKPETRPQLETMQAATMVRGKQSATYWLALIMFEQQDYPGAIEYLERFILKDDPKSRWATSARYLLARSYEAQGDRDRAIALYQSDRKSPQADGNQLRARWLKASEVAAADTPIVESTAPSAVEPQPAAPAPSP
jgi:tetratricopeptide (TPR) repeat protein